MKRVFAFALLVMLLTLSAAPAEVLFFTDAGLHLDGGILEVTQMDGAQFLVPLAGIPRVHAPEGLIGLDVVQADMELFEKAELVFADGAAVSTVSRGQLAASPLHAVVIRTIGSVPDTVENLVVIQDGDFPAHTSIYAAEGLMEGGLLSYTVASGERFILILQTGGSEKSIIHAQMPVNISGQEQDESILIKAYYLNGEEAPFVFEVTKGEELHPAEAVHIPTVEPVAVETEEEATPEPVAEEVWTEPTPVAETSPEPEPAPAVIEVEASFTPEETFAPEQAANVGMAELVYVEAMAEPEPVVFEAPAEPEEEDPAEAEEDPSEEDLAPEDPAEEEILPVVIETVDPAFVVYMAGDGTGITPSAVMDADEPLPLPAGAYRQVNSPDGTVAFALDPSYVSGGSITFAGGDNPPFQSTSAALMATFPESLYLYAAKARGLDEGEIATYFTLVRTVGFAPRFVPLMQVESLEDTGFGDAHTFHFIAPDNVDFTLLPFGEPGEDGIPPMYNLQYRFDNIPVGATMASVPLIARGVDTRPVTLDITKKALLRTADDAAPDPVMLLGGTLYVPDPGVPRESLTLSIEENGLQRPLFASDFTIVPAPEGMIGIEIFGMDIHGHEVLTLSSFDDAMRYESYIIMRPLPAEGQIHAIQIETQGLVDGTVADMYVDNALMTFSSGRPLTDADVHVFPSPDFMRFTLIAAGGTDANYQDSRLGSTSVDVGTLAVGESRELSIQPLDDSALPFTVTFTKVALLRGDGPDTGWTAAGLEEAADGAPDAESAPGDEGASGQGSSAAIAEETVGFVTVRTSANVREGDSTDYAIARTVRPGQVFRTVGRTENGWFIIELTSDTLGYIAPGTVSFSRSR